jgi:hypothetical protein
MRMKRGGEEELAALADGSLPPERQAELGARIEASPVLAERLSEQERAVALLRGAGEEVEAPSGLRARVEAQRSARNVRRPRRLAVGGLAAAAAAVALVAAVVIVGSGSQGTRFKAALGPTALVPGAHGEATLTKTSSGWRIHLDASGLPRLSGERFYEAWLRSSDGVLVPIGTFNEGPNVTLWAGVSPASYRVLTVTRERADGNQASSGQKVLAGPVRTG